MKRAVVNHGSHDLVALRQRRSKAKELHGEDASLADDPQSLESLIGDLDVEPTWNRRGNGQLIGRLRMQLV